MHKWYVVWYKDGVKRGSSFEDDEKQARHFASLVNGKVIKLW